MSYNSLISKRIEQLTDEKSIDDRLQTAPCTPRVLEYLFKTRELNRKLAMSGYNSTILTAYSNAQRNLEIYSQLHHIFRTDDHICDQLDNGIKYIHSVLDTP
jgi:hypothetical protein